MYTVCIWEQERDANLQETGVPLLLSYPTIHIHIQCTHYVYESNRERCQSSRDGHPSLYKFNESSGGTRVTCPCSYMGDIYIYPRHVTCVSCSSTRLVKMGRILLFFSQVGRILSIWLVKLNISVTLSYVCYTLICIVWQFHFCRFIRKTTKKNDKRNCDMSLRDVWHVPPHAV